MQTWQLSLRRFFPFILLIIFAAAAFFALFYPRTTVLADKIVLKEGDLFSISETLGEKRLTNDKSVKILFDQRDKKILFGRGWGNELQEEGGRIGGTELWLFDENTGQFLNIHKGFEATYGLLGRKNDVYYTTRDQELMVNRLDGKPSSILRNNVLLEDISPDGTKVLYQKLPEDWSLGEYYDGALGFHILNLLTNSENKISDTFEDWGGIFTPDGKKIIFVSRSPQGFASFFSMNADGSEKTQLTNIGQKRFSEETIPVLSERPIFSKDGRFFLYEGDRAIYVLRFNNNFTKVEKAERIAYGINPQWIEEGKTFSVVVAPASESGGKILKIDLRGNLVK